MDWRIKLFFFVRYEVRPAPDEDWDCDVGLKVQVKSHPEDPGTSGVRGLYPCHDHQGSDLVTVKQQEFLAYITTSFK
jgi:hypothetical protein